VLADVLLQAPVSGFASQTSFLTEDPHLLIFQLWQYSKSGSKRQHSAAVFVDRCPVDVHQSLFFGTWFRDAAPSCVPALPRSGPVRIAIPGSSGLWRTGPSRRALSSPGNPLVFVGKWGPPNSMLDDRIRWQIDKADSWSVEYRGTPYDDARQVDGRWYYRDLLTLEYREFASQHDVVALSKNGPTDRR
jgi:hypothetical protein